MKKLMKIAVGVISVGGGVAAVGYSMIKRENKFPVIIHNARWYKKLSDSEWEKERDILAKIRNSPEYPNFTRIKIAQTIESIDDLRRSKTYTGLENYKFPVHGDHGTNLYKKDWL